ncbi:TetR/AcrR family transcriptional regulator [Reticulibacter mediterranei]|uniref:TetR/AcrR family transcriptional regulator n=1 Tax=Reticulibacter mediterranei TaxID=2778369 RepID=UPI001C68DDB2|nr:TetR/AcrR family transcriptional regulator [Reticulibacter mediterranei]
MPLKLYEKAHILEVCLGVFARHGYANTSTAMLAEASGISKALIFHHFESKKELYLRVVEQCLATGGAELGIDALPQAQDFFEARIQLSLRKFRYYQKHPDVSKVLREAFYATPPEVKADLAATSRVLIARQRIVWEQLFEKVPLKEGVDRREALELVMLTIEHFEQQYLSEFVDDAIVDEASFQRLFEKRNRFLAMIRSGIAL